MPVRRGLHGPQSTARVRQRRGAVSRTTTGAGQSVEDGSRAEAAVRRHLRGGTKYRSGHASRYGKLV
ncbi:hypothetical protein SNL152K_2741 [Streptomyces sp. NL15-2K]|nr:hypothetical protein SNL152K_2741 [Streptomyces sp. NL15-2K]